MKILKVGKPGYSVEILHSTLEGSLYKPTSESKETPVAGIIFPENKNGVDQMLQFMAARRCGAVRIHCEEFAREQWLGLLSALQLESVELVQTVLLFERIECAPDWLAKELAELCDTFREVAFIIATTSNYRGVSYALKERLLGYRGLSSDGHMTFEMPSLIKVDAGSMHSPTDN